MKIDNDIAGLFINYVKSEMILTVESEMNNIINSAKEQGGFDDMVAVMETVRDSLARKMSEKMFRVRDPDQLPKDEKDFNESLDGVSHE